MLWGQQQQGAIVFRLVLSEISHWVGNENQDTVALLENCVDVKKKRGTRLREANGFVKSTR
jgi:hypothetical protein